MDQSEMIIPVKRRKCGTRLVKVSMKGHVGVHGGLFHWNRPYDPRSVCVVQVTATTTHWDP